MRHVFHPEAALEFEEAIRYYKQRGRNLGPRFNLELRKTIGRIVKNPERWGLVQADVHRCFVRMFPYRVFYTIESGYVLILAVAHDKREPGYWRHRVGTKPRA